MGMAGAWLEAGRERAQSECASLLHAFVVL